MKALTQVWRAVRVYVFAFLSALAAQSIFNQGAPNHWTWAAVASAVVAALEVTYRQFVPTVPQAGVAANMVAAYKLIKSSDTAAKAAVAAPASVVNVVVPPPAPVVVPPTPHMPGDPA